MSVPQFMTLVILLVMLLVMGCMVLRVLSDIIALLIMVKRSKP